MGQHFLADERVRLAVLEHLAPRPDDCWLEIGPGHGEITRYLSERSKFVLAVERDAKLAGALRNQMPSEKVGILEADILDVSPADLARRHGVDRWRVYGSLPYYITSPILHRLFDSIEVIEDAFVIVQREVAGRLTATPGRRDYAYLSVAAQFFTRPCILREIPPGAFKPPPKVSSALVALTAPGEQQNLPVADAAGFLKFVQGCFQQKRKTLLNNLTRRFPSQAVLAGLEENRLDARCRAEEITLAQFASLYGRLAGLG